MHSQYHPPPLESTPSPGASAPLGKQHEITQHPRRDKAAIARRLDRFDLHDVVREILNKDSRVGKCLHTPRRRFVTVNRSVKNDLAYYGGLVICGNVWTCPVCSTKISEKRIPELRDAISRHEATGGVVTMVTLTFPHYINDDCNSQVEKFAQARRYLKNHRQYKRLMSAIGLAGDIYRLEVTHGANGWHIHCHAMLFLSGNVRLTSAALWPLWVAACESVGLPSPSKAHGVKVSTPKELADYLAKQGKETSKWTIELEMTKGHIKTGKVEGMTPWDFLRAYKATGDEKYARLFREYAASFKGRKQLVWSRGLRDRLGMCPEISDEEAAQSVDEMDQILAQIPQRLWSYIRKNKFRGKLLEAANQGNEILRQAIDILQISAGYVDIPF